MMDVLVAGFHGRAIGEQIYKEGHNVMVVDYFGDRDTDLLNKLNFVSPKEQNDDKKNWIESYGLMREGFDFNHQSLFEKTKEKINNYNFNVFVFASNLENYPMYLKDFESIGDIQFTGNKSEVLESVNKEMRSYSSSPFFDLLIKSGISYPETYHFDKDTISIVNNEAQKQVLVKPVTGGGGLGIKKYSSAETAYNYFEMQTDLDYFLQDYVKGKSCSVVFVADGKKADIIGITEQIIGEPRLGAADYKYCGNITTELSKFSKTISKKVKEMVETTTRYFGLTGLNGIDFIIQHEDIFFIELNPRLTASVELFGEKSVPLFKFHLDGSKGDLNCYASRDSADSTIKGKAILYAERDLTVISDLADLWQADPFIGRVSIKDIPAVGEIFEKGDPLVSIYARERSEAEIWDKFMFIKSTIYQDYVR